MIYFCWQETSLIRCIGFVIVRYCGTLYAFRNGEMDEQIINGYQYIIIDICLFLSLALSLSYTSRLIHITSLHRLAYTAVTLYFHHINVILGAIAPFV